MTKLCARGKAAAKRKFRVYPSAYANAYASKICAGKIKDPSGLKRKDFKGPKPAGKKIGGEAKINKVIGGLKKASKLHAAQAKSLESITKAKPGIINPKITFEIRAYYFEKVLSDSVKEIFGGSSYFHVGFYDKIMVSGRETDFSFLVGKTHLNSIGFILTNGTQIPLKLKNENIKLYLISKTTIMQKFDNKYTGWLDLGISMRYDINSSKITKNRGLIKRRQTIIK